MKSLKLGLPKGSLEKATFDLFDRAGFRISGASRSYYPYVDDSELEIILFRPQEMSRYVEEGIIDAGLTGYDWTVENKSKVLEVLELSYSKQTSCPVRWVLAVPNDSKIKSVKQLQGKKIVTELVQVTKDYLKKNKVKAEVEFSWGATEAKPPRLADAIVEATETGTSLKVNNLRIIDTVLTSTTRMICNRDSWKNSWKKEKIQNIGLLLKGAMAAASKVGLKMNVPEKSVAAILAVLPALKNPTVSQLSSAGWVAVEVIIDEHVVREIIPRLKKAGASGIIEYPLNKVID